jgi:hypothetical protein
MIYTSHSSRGTFKACKRKYHWGYIKGLQQTRKPKALRMGSAWSDGLEHGKQAINEYYEEILRDKNTPVSWFKDLAHEMLVLEALYDTYPYAMGEQREVSFRHVGPNYEDRGQLDGVKLNERPLAPVTIIENKLYARFGNQEREKLEFDEQVTSYVAAMIDGECEDIDIEGLGQHDVEVLYNVTLKPALRQKVNESDKDLTQRCVADIFSRPDHYHHQVVLNRSDEELQDFRERRDKHVMDLMYEEKMNVWERSPGNCFDYGQCPFLNICRSPQLDEVPDGYTKREDRT